MRDNRISKIAGNSDAPGRLGPGQPPCRRVRRAAASQVQGETDTQEAKVSLQLQAPQLGGHAGSTAAKWHLRHVRKAPPARGAEPPPRTGPNSQGLPRPRAEPRGHPAAQAAPGRRTDRLRGRSRPSHGDRVLYSRSRWAVKEERARGGAGFRRGGGGPAGVVGSVTRRGDVVKDTSVHTWERRAPPVPGAHSSVCLGAPVGLHLPLRHPDAPPVPFDVC